MSFLRDQYKAIADAEDVPLDLLSGIARIYIEAGGQLTAGMWLELPRDERIAFHRAMREHRHERMKALVFAVRNPEGIAQLEAEVDNRQALHDLFAKWTADKMRLGG